MRKKCEIEIFIVLYFIFNLNTDTDKAKIFNALYMFVNQNNSYSNDKYNSRETIINPNKKTEFTTKHIFLF